jgi:hypothetical protein
MTITIIDHVLSEYNERGKNYCRKWSKEIQSLSKLIFSRRCFK